jgi:hypothetical protein
MTKTTDLTDERLDDWERLAKDGASTIRPSCVLALIAAARQRNELREALGNLVHACTAQDIDPDKILNMTRYDCALVDARAALAKAEIS